MDILSCSVPEEEVFSELIKSKTSVNFLTSSGAKLMAFMESAKWHGKYKNVIFLVGGNFVRYLSCK